MDGNWKPGRDSKRRDLSGVRRTLVGLIQLCADDTGSTKKVDVYREARRRGISPTDTEEALQLLSSSDAIVETTDDSLRLTYQ